MSLLDRAEVPEAQVTGLDQSDRQASGGGVDRRTGAGHPAADDEDVEALPAQSAHIGRAARERELTGGVP